MSSSSLKVSNRHGSTRWRQSGRSSSSPSLILNGPEPDRAACVPICRGAPRLQRSHVLARERSLPEADPRQTPTAKPHPRPNSKPDRLGASAPASPGSSTHPPTWLAGPWPLQPVHAANPTTAPVSPELGVSLLGAAHL